VRQPVPGNLGSAPKVPPESSASAGGSECGRFADKPAFGRSRCQMMSDQV